MSKATTSPGLTFRRFEWPDFPGLVSLWETAGWGSLDEAMWREWYEDTPHGPGIVTIVEDTEGDIAGQFAMVPAEVAIRGRSVPALRSSAVLLREDLIFQRSVDGDSGEFAHPLLGLPAAGFELAREQGFALVYSFPHRIVLPILRILDRSGIAPVQLAKYGCVEIEGQRASTDADRGLHSRTIKALGEEHEELATQTPSALSVDCHVVRSLDWMRWRLGSSTLVEVRTRAGQLVALTATDPQDGLLTDIHVADATYLTASFSAAARSSPSGRLKVMALPQFTTALEGAGGVSSDYKFAFACWSIDEERAPSADIAPSSWLPMHAD